MSKPDYEARCVVYDRALDAYGPDVQLTVALEELSEAQKEICKMLRGMGNIENLAEEIADAEIMLEQVKNMFNIEELVDEVAEKKLDRLQRKIEEDRG